MKKWFGRTPRSLSSALAVLLLLPTGPIQAQVTAGDIIGTVTDVSGAAITNATVTATKIGTSVTKTVTLNGNPDFMFTLLQVGTYKLSVQSPGFKSYTTQVTLAAGDRARVNASLHIGQTSETVTVECTPPTLATNTSEIGNLLTSQATQDLPLKGGNVLNFITLSPGLPGIL